MRKILSVLLVLAMVCSFGISAMAAGSPVAEDTAAEIAAAVIESAEVTDAEGNTVEAEIVAMGDEALTEEDAAAIEEAIAAVEEGKAVVAAFMLNTGAEVSAEAPIMFKFSCEGENVGLSVNGNEMEVQPMAEENWYTATITEAGAVVITCDEA